MKRIQGQDGYALITVLVLLALLMSLLLTHFGLTWVEMSTTKSSMDSFVGFYAAEAGLNVRADVVRSAFQGYGLPGGASPAVGGTPRPCEATNQGSGELGCVHYQFQKRDVATYLVETPDSGNPIVVPRGEMFQNLNGREYHYVVYSRAENAKSPEAVLEVHVKSRLIPVFQFAAFYDKDLEILPGAAMTLAGPVHSNGDLYLGTGTNLDITGQVSTSGDLYRGRKDADTCLAGPVRVNDPETLTEIPVCSATRKQIAAVEVEPWDGMVQPGGATVTVPEAAALDALPGSPYWDRADLRLVLDLAPATPVVRVMEADGTPSVAKTAVLGACGVAAHSDTLYDQREAEWIEMLDVDIKGLLDCAHANSLMSVGLDDATDGGLVWFFGVAGPDSAVLNDYGVRVHNGAELVSTLGGAPAIQGLSLVTDQALYIEGDYNSVNKKPASLLADSANLLSNAWSDGDSADPLTDRVASDTIVQAAILAGTDTTGGIDGVAGQDIGAYNGGLEDILRLHEDWSGSTLTYRGSFVSLDAPRHVDGAWAYGAPRYLAPVSDWGYDTDFEDAALLPPMPPQFVYVKQELFVRQFEL